MSEDTPSTQTDGLTLLGKGQTDYPGSPAAATLEAFPNPNPKRDYVITFDCPEFTALCPITGQPDFGHITIEYVAAECCLESKSLKLYLFSFRNEGAFHEAVVNRILDDIVAITQPRRATVHGNFNPRGGIALKVTASYPDA
jgi:7-cyano-7-deazaguanine reductase